MLLSTQWRRTTGFGLLVSALVLAGGCSWFRQKVDYQSSPESRPLEVPPDLDAPVTDPAMTIPSVGGAAAANASAPLRIDDSVDSAWRRLGLALDRIDGVEVTEKAQALAAYEVRFDGQQFLLRVVADGAASRIEAVDAAGKAVGGGAAGRLIEQLRSRLG